jgi:hypothetical protein
MQGPWFGIVIMTLMVVGIGVWVWYAMRADKPGKKE